MSYVYSHALKPKRPGFLSMLAGFTISTMVGIIFGQISSFMYSLIGQGGGLECLTFPIKVLIFGGSIALSFFITCLIHKIAV
jgi:hypothetical protein